ncbi:MAG: DUF1572 family protein [Trueperaceae bacterium]
MGNDTHILKTLSTALVAQRRLAEAAMEQLSPMDLHWSPNDESNSVATIVKHVSGNMRSRWTDFLTTDGEKPTRDRDSEFVDDLESPEQLMRVWEEGWTVLFDTLSSLEPGQLQNKVMVNGREMSVCEAFLGQLAHYAQHVGQIIYIAKVRRGERWRTLSIPKRRPG